MAETDRWIFSVSDKGLILKRIDEVERFLEHISDKTLKDPLKLNASIGKTLCELKSIKELVKINFSTLYDLLETIQKSIYLFDLTVGKAGNVFVVEMDIRGEDDEK